MSIVVTGASGQFGQLAVAGLLAQVPASDLILVHRGTEALLRACGMDWTALRNSHYADAIVQAIARLRSNPAAG